jgi:hypothetical protein
MITAAHIIIHGCCNALFFCNPAGNCLKTLYIMAFTSGLTNAGTDAGHSVQLQTRRQTKSLRLYDRPGDDALENKGDVWEFPISRFRFTDSCVTIGEICGVAIVQSSNDGWNIQSIVTLVKDATGTVQLLTQNLGVNRWIDGNAHASHRRFELYNTCPTTGLVGVSPANFRGFAH